MLARPDEAYPIVQVAGTNGKTSTSRMIATLVSAHGLSTGLFTSPWLDRVEQQFALSGFEMTPAEFAEAMTLLAPVADLHDQRTGDGVTAFELSVALAYSWFADRTVDAGIIEAGLGGRGDATNAATSEVAVVTNVALDHTEYLGDTVGAIAAEKFGILDPGAFLVTGPLADAATAVAEAVVAEREARWFRYGTEFRPTGELPSDHGWVFDVSGVYDEYTGLDLRLRGRHQVTNFAVAVAAVEALFDRALDEAAVRETAARVTSPGRMEIAGREPWVILDGAHNPAGMETLAAALREEFAGVSWTLVFGVMQDKDLGGILDALEGRVASAHVAAATSPRAMAATEAAAAIRSRFAVPATVHGSVAEAVAAARAAGSHVLVTGSLAVVGEARAALGVA